jgi:hypothetical protein
MFIVAPKEPARPALPKINAQRVPAPLPDAGTVRRMCRAALLHYLTEKLAGFSQLAETELRARLHMFFALPPAAQMSEAQTAELHDLFLRAEAQRLARALLASRICDPAMGAGALLAGMLEELAVALAKLDLQLYGRAASEQRNYDFGLKCQLVNDCLYGVDIDETAVARCRQRLRLALEQSASTSAPGLFSHLVCGDSLLGCRAFEDGSNASFKWRKAFPEIFAKGGGFDIILCNPPARSEVEKDALAQICALFPHVKRAQQIAAAFFDLPRLIGAPHAVACQVVPKALTYAEGWAATRAFLRMNYRLLSATEAGETTQSDQEVLLYARDGDTPAEPLIQPAASRQLNGSAPVKASTTTSAQHLSPVGRAMLERFAQLRRLGDFVTLKQGQNWQRRHNQANNGHAAVPVIKATDIQQFRLKELLSQEPPAYLRRVLEELRQPKLVAPHSLSQIKKPAPTLLLHCAIERSGAVGLATVNQIFPQPHCPYSLEFLCGLLNSSLMHWFCYHAVFACPARAPALEAAHLHCLPLPRHDPVLLPQVEVLVRQLSQAKSARKYFLRGQSAAYDALDELICDLFELSAEERGEVFRQEFRS